MIKNKVHNIISEEQVIEELEHFKPISLNGILKIELLSRRDSKYVFGLHKLIPMLQRLRDQYEVLTIDGLRLFNYESMYFDTADFSLYRAHHNGKLNRYKIRYRRYVDTDTCFFEIKFKTNKGRTIKTRIQDLFINSSIEGKSIAFIEENTPYLANDFEPKLLIFYKRITLASIERQERFTIDLSLDYFNFQDYNNVPNLVIAEVKQDRVSLESPIFRVFKELRIKPMGMSKYCIGIVKSYPNLKTNRFKPKILMLNKIANGVI